MTAEEKIETPGDASSEAMEFGPDFRKRLTDVVEKLGGNAAAGRIVGFERQTVHQWKQGKGKISLAAAVALARAAGHSIEWLVDGVEPDAATSQKTDNRRSALLAAAGGPLPPAILAQIRRVAKMTGPLSLAAPDEGSEETSALPPDFVLVPMLHVSASAGRGRFTTADDLADGEMIPLRETWLRSLGLKPGRTHILWALGDSMFPTIRNGDVLLVDRMIDRVVDDGIYVVVVGGGVVVKRIQLQHNGSVVLRSDNDRYEQQTIPADEVPSLVVEGRVRWVGGPI